MNQIYAGDADSDNIKKSKQRGRCKLAPFSRKYSLSSRYTYMYVMSMSRFFYQNIRAWEYLCRYRELVRESNKHTMKQNSSSHTNPHNIACLWAENFERFTSVTTDKMPVQFEMGSIYENIKTIGHPFLKPKLETVLMYFWMPWSPALVSFNIREHES